MKRMIRILMIAICCMLTCNMAANAGNDKPIAINALPVKAQTLLNNHFKGQKVIGLSLPAFAAILHVSMQQMAIIKILIILFISHNIKSL